VSSIPDVVIAFFNWPNLCSCAMALGSTQRLTEMSTRNLLEGKGRLARKADLTAICEPTVQKMWKPRRLTTLWAFKTCYRDSFTFLPYNLCLELASGLFPCGFPIKIIYTSIYIYSYSSCIFYMPCPSHPPCPDHCNYVCRTVQVMKFITTSSPYISSGLYTEKFSLHIFFPEANFSLIKISQRGRISR
jgi:hypothetical protein